jgi:MFS family permease
MSDRNNSKQIKHIFRTLKYRNYRLYFGGQSLSLVGTWIQMLAMSWLVYRLTGSVFILGLVGFLSRLPTFFLSPFAGVIVDRWNKYRLLLLTQILSMLQSAILTILVFTDVIQVWHIIVLGVFLGLVNSLDIPVRQSFVVEMIEKKEDLSNAIALNSAMVNGARLFGPSIAGILVAAVGEGWCFLINTLSFVAILMSLLFMTITFKQPERKVSGHLSDLKGGFKYAFGFPPIRAILLLLALVSFMGMPYQVLMPVFAKEILHGGPHTLGFLMAGVGAGALFGALYLASRKSVRGLGRIIPIASAIFGAGLILFSFSDIFWLSFIILVFTGFGMMVEMTSSNTLLQTLTDDDKRGRVMSFYTMSFMGMVPFGNLLAGTLSDLIGVTYTVMVGGICCVLGAFYFYTKLPMIRKYARPIYIEKNIITIEE